MKANTKAADTGKLIVESHGGKTGEALAVSILAGIDPALAGRYVGQRIVAEHGGKTGRALAEDMLCAAE